VSEAAAKLHADWATAGIPRDRVFTSLVPLSRRVTERERREKREGRR
jgi:hypothetical protein